LKKMTVKIWSFWLEGMREFLTQSGMSSPAKDLYENGRESYKAVTLTCRSASEELKDNEDEGTMRRGLIASSTRGV